MNSLPEGPFTPNKKPPKEGFGRVEFDRFCEEIAARKIFFASTDVKNPKTGRAEVLSLSFHINIAAQPLPDDQKFYFWVERGKDVLYGGSSFDEAKWCYDRGGLFETPLNVDERGYTTPGSMPRMRGG